MRSPCLARLLLVVLPVAAGAAPQNNKVLINSTTKTDAPAQPGQASSEAAAGARVMEVFTAIALAEQYPCMPSMTPSDISTLLGHERDRELLGAEEDPVALAAIANAVDAGYLIHINFTQTGGSAFITITVINARTAAVIARYTKTLPINDKAVDEMEAFAKASVNAIGAAFPTCPGKDWKGTITCVLGRNHNETTTSNVKVKNAGEANLTCVLTGDATKSRCSYASQSVMTTEFNSITIEKNAVNADADIRILIGNGKLTLSLGKIPVMVQMKDSKGTPGLGSEKDELNLGSYEVPAGPDPKRQAGSWTNPNPTMKELGLRETVTWSLRKE